MSDGVKMVLIDETTPKKSQKSRQSARVSSNDERYYKLLEAQNAKLQERVETLENETRTLRDQKEQMLIEERQKIEQIYRDKDEQLKNILNTLSSKFMLGAPLESQEEDDTLEAETIEVEECVDQSSSHTLSLKRYLKKEKFSEKKIQKIHKRFKKALKSNDERIILIGKKIYIDPKKYDYNDLIKK